MNLIEYPDSEMMMIDLANKIAGELKSVLIAEGRAVLAVPGGTTPGPVFDELSAADLDWKDVTVVLTDERRVPSDHPRSNERLVRAHLLTGRAAAANFVRLVPAEGETDLGPLCARASELLPLSVLVLGMGADMHTASLFPGSPELAGALDRNAPPLMLVTAPGAPEPRVTLTGPVLTGALNAHVVITGEEKRKAVEAARSLSPEEAPIALVLGEADIHWAP